MGESDKFDSEPKGKPQLRIIDGDQGLATRAKDGSTVTPIQDRLLSAIVDIYQNPISRDDLSFTPRELIQATLPYKNPKDVEVWKRRNGNYSLLIRPGWNPKTDETYGFPYGALPRLLIYWLVSEAVKTESRRLELGSSFNEFVLKLNLNPNRGGKRSDKSRLKDQMTRLFRSQISFVYDSEDRHDWLDMPVAPKGSVWWSEAYPDQGSLFDSWIELNEDFYKAITLHAVPLDIRIVTAIKHSPLALDLYAWTTYRAFAAYRTGKPQVIPWEALKKQLGTSYGRTRAFKDKARQHLQEICHLYKELRIEEDGNVITIRPCRPSVPFEIIE